jgi:hypothetical protein
VTSTTLPHPLIDDGVVSIDSRSRTLTVRPAPHASGTAKLLWRDAVAAQAATTAVPRRTVWASTVGKWQVSCGVPAGADALEFPFHGRDAVFQELVSTSGLNARIGFDRASNQIIGVTFKGKA